MGPSGKLTQHVSYRKPYGLLATWVRRDPAGIKHHCAAWIVTSGFILPNELTPKSTPRATVRLLFTFLDPDFSEFMKSQKSCVGSFCPPRDPQGSPRGAPGGPQKAPRGPPRAAKHQTHIKLTSNSHRTHIELTSNSHRTHREPNLYTLLIGS